MKLSSKKLVANRHSALQVNVGCELQQNGVIKAINWTEDELLLNRSVSSKFDIRMTFYDSTSFNFSVLDKYVYLEQDIFVQISLHSSETNLVIFVDTCTASRHSFDWAYVLIKNG